MMTVYKSVNSVFLFGKYFYSIKQMNLNYLHSFLIIRNFTQITTSVNNPVRNTTASLQTSFHNTLNVAAKLFSISHTLCKKWKKSNSIEETQDLNQSIEQDKIDEVINDKDYEVLVSAVDGRVKDLTTVAVIQPWVKWGPQKKKNTSPQLLLEEACALVSTLPGVNVVFAEHVNRQPTEKHALFGSGTTERLVNDTHKAQTVFISVECLNKAQTHYFQKLFKKVVLDRYTVVLGIFHHYATTQESKLQIALAELPYIRWKVLTETQKLVLDSREKKLKKVLSKISARRDTYRKKRINDSIPSVAIIGYTNCGKTTLIRALTGDTKLEGENRLFATLDVTSHGARLPCGVTITLVDTVGFVQDIPTTLLASFHATLQDALYADVIIHIRDVSHPDLIGQDECVLATLKQLSVAKSTPIITVDNKSDLVNEQFCSGNTANGAVLPISATTGMGLDVLVSQLQNQIIQVTNRKVYRMQYPTGSRQIAWLRLTCGIAQEMVSESDTQMTKILVVMTKAQVAAFKKSFI